MMVSVLDLLHPLYRYFQAHAVLRPSYRAWMLHAWSPASGHRQAHGLHLLTNMVA